MELLSLFMMATMPVMQVLIIGSLGALLSSSYINILSPEARSSINKMVYFVFTPALLFSSLARTVTLEEFISWWFMPVNIGMTFLIGGIFGWIAVNMLKPPKYLDGLIIANCAAGNTGNIMFVIIPAICSQQDNPFGDINICNAQGLSYVSFSMAVGMLFIWTIAYNLVKNSISLYKSDSTNEINNTCFPCRENNENRNIDQEALLLSLIEKMQDATEHNKIMMHSSHRKQESRKSCTNIIQILYRIVEGFVTPSFVSSVLGFIIGVIPWTRSLFSGDFAPLKVVLDSLILLGDGTVPCTTLVLGGNLTQVL